jgi:hypothetical protein
MWRIVSVAAALVLAAANAQAGEASAVAERGGFLLGHAYRCGVEDQRLEAPARLVHDLIAALSASVEETAAADQAFADRVLASVFAAVLRDPAPSCSLVRRELAQFERHQPAPSARGETHMSSNLRAPQTPEKHVRVAQMPRAKKLTETRHENPTPSQRAELGRKLAAKEHRNHPPSI